VKHLLRYIVSIPRFIVANSGWLIAACLLAVIIRLVCKVKYERPPAWKISLGYGLFWAFLILWKNTRYNITLLSPALGVVFPHLTAFGLIVAALTYLILPKISCGVRPPEFK
jgi:hypothetical protein